MEEQPAVWRARAVVDWDRDLRKSRHLDPKVQEHMDRSRDP